METVDEAMAIFFAQGVDVEPRYGAQMVSVTYSGSRYQYFPTTGRWGVYNKHTNYPYKHYSSKNTQDFIDRFLFKTTESTV